MEQQQYNAIGLQLQANATLTRDEQCSLCRFVMAARQIESSDRDSLEQAAPSQGGSAGDSDESCSGNDGIPWELGCGFPDLALYSDQVLNTGVDEPVRIMPRTSIDVAILRSWITVCETQHLDTCGWTADRKRHLQTPILLIDVKLACIVASSTKERYMALSYVWGGVSQFTTTKKDLPNLLDERSLSTLALSRTVVDAISVTAALGERFLWIDTLCIVQDDLARKQRAIDSMSAIYNSALCTIVAVSAVDADSGLPGVRSNTRHFGNHVVEAGIVICEQDDDQSIYYSRGWTYQEALLSRRCLFFGRQRVEFHCSQCSWREDLRGSSPATAWGERKRSIPLEPSIDHFGDMVQTYSERLLSYLSDRYNAFAGVVQYLEERWAWRFHYGLPVADLHKALLWFSLLPQEDDAPVSSFPSPSSSSSFSFSSPSCAAVSIPLLDFPSWSWLSSPAGISFAHALCRLPSLVPLFSTLDVTPDLSTGRSSLHFVGPTAHLSATNFSLDTSHPDTLDYLRTTCILDSDGRFCGLLVGDCQLTAPPSGGSLLLLALSAYTQPPAPATARFWTPGALGYTIETPFDVQIYPDCVWEQVPNGGEDDSNEGEEQPAGATINVMLVQAESQFGDLEKSSRRTRRVAVGEVHRNAFWALANVKKGVTRQMDEIWIF